VVICALYDVPSIIIIFHYFDAPVVVIVTGMKVEKCIFSSIHSVFLILHVNSK